MVLATNIAETSLTIEGIRTVVDSARERVARFDPRTGLTRLVTQRISRASMTQRAGRAGRLSRGSACICSAKNRRNGRRRRASRRSCTAICRRCYWSCCSGAATIRPRWRLDQPPAVNLAAARRLLEALSALDGERLSAFGRKMAALGNEPRLAAMLAAAQTDDEAATAAKLAAILEEPPRGGLVDLGPSFPVSRPTGSSERSS